MKHSRLKKRTAVGLGVAVLISAQLLGWISLSGSVQDSMRPIGTPLTHWGQSLGIVFNNFWHAGSLNQRNQELQNQNQQLLTQITELESLKLENDQLRAQLKYEQKVSTPTINADVIGFAPDSSRKLLLINQGKAADLTPGMVVISANQLVGKLYQVNAHSSTVLLISDEQFRVLALDLATHSPGIVRGQVGGSVLMEQIPRDRPVAANQVIVTSGLGGDFPRDLVIGMVSGVSQDAQGIFQTAQLQQTFTATDLRVVSVLNPSIGQ